MAAFPAKAFSVTQGRPKYYKSSEWAQRGFCSDCGTPLIFHDLTDTIGIMVGSLDHPEDWPPDIGHSGMEIYIPWFQIDDRLPQGPTEGSDDMKEVAQALAKGAKLGTPP
jgi:hypothetical protein